MMVTLVNTDKTDKHSTAAWSFVILLISCYTLDYVSSSIFGNQQWKTMKIYHIYADDTHIYQALSPRIISDCLNILDKNTNKSKLSRQNI